MAYKLSKCFLGIIQREHKAKYLTWKLRKKFTKPQVNKAIVLLQQFNLQPLHQIKPKSSPNSINKALKPKDNFNILSKPHIQHDQEAISNFVTRNAYRLYSIQGELIKMIVSWHGRPLFSIYRPLTRCLNLGGRGGGLYSVIHR